ncbi:MAG: DoxX family protein [Bacteroidota bacterium]
MKAIDKINKWANERTNIAIDLLRIGVGVFFFIKGIQFADQTQAIVDLIQPKSSSFLPVLIAHYVVMGHFAGGILIVFGLLTRLACLVQLPIVVGAVIVNFAVAMNTNDLIQASIATIFTVFFLIFGSGKHSVDYNLKLHF